MKQATDTVTLSKKDFDLLTSMYPNISALKQHLEGVVHPKYTKEIELIEKKMETVFSPFWKEEDKAYDKNYKELSKISDKNKFRSAWSITEVSATQMNDDFTSPVKQLSYQGQVITYDSPQTFSWLEMWKEADKIIRMSGDEHHIFIEDFHADKKNPGHYSLSTGS